MNSRNNFFASIMFVKMYKKNKIHSFMEMATTKCPINVQEMSDN